MSIDTQVVTLKRTTLLLALIWTTLSLLSFFWDSYSNRSNMLAIAEQQAKLVLEKEFVLRSWVLSHNGIYVEISEETPPNPLIPEDSDKYATTDGGKRLTLMNPAYVTRQLHDIGGIPGGIRGHLSSLDPMREDNEPDPWERAALESFTGNGDEVKGLSKIDGETYYRIIKPVVGGEGCGGCHAGGGVAGGNVRGGVSVSVPMDEYLRLHNVRALQMGGLHFTIWALGMLGLFAGSRNIREKMLKQAEAEAAWLKSASMLESVSRVAPVGIGIVVNRVFTWVNEQFQIITGYTDEELLGKKARLIYRSEEEYKAVGVETQNQMTKAGVGSIETKFKRKDGEIVDIFLSSTPIDGGDFSKGITFTALDITEIKESEAKLRQSKEFLQTIIDSFPESILVINADHSIAMMNQAAKDRSSSGHSEADYLYCFEVNHGEAHPCPEAENDCPVNIIFKTGRKLTTEHTHLDKDGNARITEVIAAPIFNEGGEVVQIIESCIDITERKKAESERLKLQRQVEHAQKLESLGVLAGGIAHDFNNLLVGVMGNAEMALMKLDEKSALRGNVESILASSIRAADLARQMLAYSGKGHFVVETMDINRMAVEMTALLESSTEKRATLHFDLAEDLPPIDADATQIRQVFMNLITNAAEAMEGGKGEIRVSTGTRELSKGDLYDMSASENAGEGLFIYIEVTDTGCGMDEETLGRVYDPFFTTKFAGRGLGLAATLGIVRGHRGAIKIESEVGKGTSVKVYLPASEGTPEKHMPDDSPVAEIGSERLKGRVLVIDDEPVVCEFAKSVLERTGLEVVTAMDGVEGLEIFREASVPFDLVLLDMVMPRMGGEEAYLALRELNPAIKIILSSGYGEQEATDHFDSKGLAGFIQKPYRPTDLTSKVSAVLSEVV
ncbi:MAG: hypothetical protein C0609_12310 [Deltaproteobacteria bacterium]|nr:MAG: hypothetical protein C0609_12310 [Deltaproteobacteria bacterium]